MLSEQEWVKLLPQIRETLEKSKGPIARWAHRPLWGFVLQLVAELEETRDSLYRQGWAHQKDVLEKVKTVAHHAYSAASRVEDAAERLEEAAEDLFDPESQRDNTWQRPALNQLILAIQQHHFGKHYGGFQFCSYPICEEARKLES